MSEMEELKKEAARSLMEQRMKELQEYISQLAKDVDLWDARTDRASLILLFVWILWMGLDFIPNGFSIGSIMYFFALIWNAQEWHQYHRAAGKFRGAVKVLRILGYLDDEDDGRDRKRRAVMTDMIEKVRQWFSEKKAAQEKVYKPA